jgi:NAD(P)-dependent dehydrogenase (short-subunit alcohol dehydrogenase family)
MTGRFAGQVALVTGAGSGIGRATCLRLAGEGAAVVCADIDEAAAEQTAATIGAAALPLACDVADPAAVRRCLEETTRWRDRLDVLCNVAGVGQSSKLEDITAEQWQRTLAVNLTGTFWLCQAAVGALEHQGGAVVNVASVAGLQGVAYAAAYAASKGGVVALSRALAAELGPRGIRVNCVCPGGVDTPMVDRFRLPAGVQAPERKARRPLAPAGDVAAAIAFLASSEASSTNGATLVVNAGVPTA